MSVHENHTEAEEVSIGNETVLEEFDVDWKKKPTVADLKQDLTDATGAHDAHVAKVETWLENLNVTGKAKRKKRKGRSSLVPKVIRKQAEWRYAALSEPFLSTDDIFNTDPKTAEDKEAAIQNGLVLNNQFNTEIDKVAFIDAYVRTVVDEGTVIVRTGWEFLEGPVEVEVPNYEYHAAGEEALEMLNAVSQDPENAPPEMLKALELSVQRKMPIMPVEVGTKMEEQIQTIHNRPTVEVCDYRHVVIDPSAKGDMNKANFVIFSFPTSKAELALYPDRYKNLDSIQADDASILGSADHNVDNFNYKDKARKKFIAHEYWGNVDVNGDGKLTAIVATWVDGTMIRMEENPFPDKQHPFVAVQYLPVRNSNHGEPDGELIAENQMIVGAVTRGVIDALGRSANSQIGIKKGVLDVTNKRLFQAGEDYEFNGQENPDMAFFMHKYPEVSNSAQWMLSNQNSDAESLTGVRPFASSTTGSIGSETAIGVKTATDATAKREHGILRRLTSGLKQIARKIISMNSEFLDEEYIVRITNDEFVPVRRDDLAGKIDIRLTISTPEADNAKAEELAFMLQTTGQTMGPEFVQIILADIARLRKMPDLAMRIKEYAPQPDPLEVKKAELEIALLEAQLQTELSKPRENLASAELDLAKADDLNSTRDLKDLDYVETETGVKQERDLEKAQAQAVGNIALEREKQKGKPTAASKKK